MVDLSRARRFISSYRYGSCHLSEAFIVTKTISSITNYYLPGLICLLLIYMLLWSEIQLSPLAHHFSSCDNPTELHKLSCRLDGGRTIG
jgi:uncharacterized membrane protein